MFRHERHKNSLVFRVHRSSKWELEYSIVMLLKDSLVVFICMQLTVGWQTKQ